MSAVIEPLPKGRATAVAGDLICPPDKSVTHRSVMLAAMAKGKSVVRSPLLGADCRSTMGVFKALGAAITIGEDAVIVESPGWDGWESPLVPLDFGNSGTTARLLTGLFAATPGLFVTCWGDASLSKRPMGRVVEPLRRVGARIHGRDGGRLLPLAIEGQRLAPTRHSVDKATAQVKSALLLAGLNVDGETVVTLPAGSRDHSEKMLAALGAQVHAESRNGLETVSVRGPFRPTARSFNVPGDPSSAAFFLVLGAIVSGQITVRSVLENPTRTGFLTVLGRMGVALASAAPRGAPKDLLEPVVDWQVTGGKTLKAVDVEPELAPTLIDEIPILAAAARFASGVSRFRGLAELRVKESDRLEMTIRLVAAAGGKAWAEGDDLFVEGSERPVPPFAFDPDDDHRLAMAAAILAKVATGPCQIKGPECVAVSFPGFFDALKRLG